MPGAERTGIIVIRVWVEVRPAADGGLRARITAFKDIARHEQETTVAATPDDVIAVVRGFLDEFIETG